MGAGHASMQGADEIASDDGMSDPELPIFDENEAQAVADWARHGTAPIPNIPRWALQDMRQVIDLVNQVRRERPSAFRSRAATQLQEIIDDWDSRVVPPS